MDQDHRAVTTPRSSSRRRTIATTPATATTLEVVAETCQQDDPAGTVDVAVSVSSSGPEISVFNCQTPYTRTGEFAYAAPEAHRIGTPTGTVGGPKPS
jgi:hypothetical protein